MINVSTQSRATLRSLQRQSWRLRVAARWAAGIAIAVAAIALFLTAVAYAPTSIRANNNLCRQQVASDDHATLEAFFQNSSEQDVLVQAITTFSR